MSYVLSVLGIAIFLFSQNIFSLFAISKLNVSKIFRYEANKSNTFNKIKKEPLINSMSSSQIEAEINGESKNEVEDIDLQSSYTTIFRYFRC